ncbi:hypothetical protein SAMN05421824_1225 [Hyunsoonleella jejuensis]|uniref:Uncharacterized protein n=1 Tax=Hyunsoonleella jejuensis TaxID=419940 RepID=A0A1H9DFT2_9FLAO|nr:hypothetical protein SAMN05421824_1225 [Hyunsoonleella jejuensis]
MAKKVVVLIPLLVLHLMSFEVSKKDMIFYKSHELNR